MPYRPTGAGAFGFSLNWEKVPGDKDVALRVVTFLEDRRLLFGERHSEDELDCVHSAIDIRRFLTEELTKAKPGRSLAESLRAMRAVMRAFVEAAGPNARNFRYHHGHMTDPFSLALGELRSLVGLHLAVIAHQYGIEVEPDLARILPRISLLTTIRRSCLAGKTSISAASWNTGDVNEHVAAPNEGRRPICAMIFVERRGMRDDLPVRGTGILRGSCRPNQPASSSSIKAYIASMVTCRTRSQDSAQSPVSRMPRRAAAFSDSGAAPECAWPRRSVTTSRSASIASTARWRWPGSLRCCSRAAFRKFSGPWTLSTF
jgi:hypothetical protein